MKEIVQDVYLLEATRGANIFLIVSGNDLILVDSGVAGGVETIKTQIIAGGYDIAILKQIVLTHSHGDHIGNTVTLVGETSAVILAHQQEIPYIEKTQPLPAATLWRRILNWLGDHLLFRLPPFKVDQGLEDGDLLPGNSGFQVIHTPGHTPGSICLYHPAKQCLLTGDALFNENPVTGNPGLRFPIPLYTIDQAQAQESVRKLAELDVDVLCCGHGEPILSQAGDKIRELLQTKTS